MLKLLVTGRVGIFFKIQILFYFIMYFIFQWKKIRFGKELLVCFYLISQECGGGVVFSFFLLLVWVVYFLSLFVCLCGREGEGVRFNKYLCDDIRVFVIVIVLGEGYYVFLCCLYFIICLIVVVNNFIIELFRVIIGMRKVSVFFYVLKLCLLQREKNFNFRDIQNCLIIFFIVRCILKLTRFRIYLLICLVIYLNSY